MTVLAGPLYAVALLLALAGLAKLARPAPTAAALRAGGLPGSPTAARLLGVVEIAVGATALVLGDRSSALLVAACYLGFAGFALRLVGRSVSADCGCFGHDDAPTTTAHIGVNLALAAVAAAAVAAPPGSVADTLSDQPMAGVPFVAITLLTTWTGYLALTLLPALQAAWAAGPAEERRGP